MPDDKGDGLPEKTYILRARDDCAYRLLASLIGKSGYSSNAGGHPSYVLLKCTRTLILRHVAREGRAALDDLLLQNDLKDAVVIEEDFRMHA